MKNEVLEMIRERESRRDKLRAQADVLDAEVKVLREALNRSQGIKSSVKRQRPLFSVGIDLLRFIGTKGTATLKEIYQYAESQEYSLKEDSLRAQMAIYAKKGWLNRVESGVFRLTEAGAEKCGYDGEKIMPPTPSLDDENGIISEEKS